MKELRKHTRLELHLPIEIKTAEGAILRGGTGNISFGGMLLDLDERSRPAVGEEIDISLILQEGQGQEDRLAIEFKSRVVHSGQYGVGVQFIAMDISQYFHFENLMVLNSPDPEKLLAELQADPGILRRDP